MKRFLIPVLFFLFAQTTHAQERTLQYFIDQGLANSPLLKDLQNQVKLNQLDSMLILATQKPQIAFTSTDYYAPVIKGYGYDDAITNGANASALVSVNKSLLNAAPNKAQFNNIQLLVRSVRNNVSITEQDIKKAIIDQYIIAYSDMLQLTATSAIRDMMYKQDTILKKLTQKNVYKQVDYLSFLVTIQQNDFKLKQQNIQYRNDYAALNYLTGSNDTTQLPLQQPDLSINVLPAADKSVFFQKFYLDSLTLVNNKRILDLTYRPKLGVYADAGYNSSLAYRPYRNIGTSFGLNLIVPIYDGRQKRLQYSKIDLQENTRQVSKQYYTNQYNQQILQLQTQLKAVSGLTDDINSQLKYIETLITVNEKLLQTGEVRIYDYIMSLTNLMNARTMINDNKISKLQITNQLNYWNR